MANLTNTLVARLPAPAKGRQLIFDEHKDAPRGFCLKITAAGGKSFCWRYAVEGRQRMKKIGDAPAWSIEAARKRAQELARGLDQGEDPLELDRQRRLEPTVAQLAEDWLTRHVAGLKSAGDIERHVSKDIVPAMGKLKVSVVRRRDFLDLIEAKAAVAPRAAAILLRTCRQIMAYAVDREVIVASPVADLKPSAIKTPENPRGLRKVVGDRVLSPTEIKAFWGGVEGSGMDRLTALALKMILATGARPGEVAGMAWSEIEGDKWTVPAQRRGKTEKSYSVHLTPTAQAILAEALGEVERRTKRRGEGGGQYVFESRKARPITRHALSRAVVRCRPKLGMVGDPWSPHDLRRSMRTGLSAVGIRPDIAELAIGHQRQGIIGTYDLHQFENEIADALARWETRLLEIISPNVISFDAKKVG